MKNIVSIVLLNFIYLIHQIIVGKSTCFYLFQYQQKQGNNICLYLSFLLHKLLLLNQRITNDGNMTRFIAMIGTWSLLSQGFSALLRQIKDDISIDIYMLKKLV